MLLLLILYNISPSNNNNNNRKSTPIIKKKSLCSWRNSYENRGFIKHTFKIFQIEQLCDTQLLLWDVEPFTEYLWGPEHCREIFGGVREVPDITHSIVCDPMTLLDQGKVDLCSSSPRGWVTSPPFVVQTVSAVVKGQQWVEFSQLLAQAVETENNVVLNFIFKPTHSQLPVLGQMCHL